MDQLVFGFNILCNSPAGSISYNSNSLHSLPNKAGAGLLLARALLVVGSGGTFGVT